MAAPETGTPDQPLLSRPTSAIKGLLPALRRLDTLLERLLQAAQTRGGVGEAALRGMYVSPEEASQLLARSPCAPALPAAPSPLAASQGTLAGASRLDVLHHWFGLSPFDLDMVLIALAPDLDLRYERIYGYLQDDATRRRATVDLALNLRTGSPEEKIARLAHFEPNAPLIRQSIVHVIPDPHHPQPPLLAHSLKVDPQIINSLLGRSCLDARLVPFCRYVDPGPGFDALQLDDRMRRSLRALGRQALATRQPLHLLFHGPEGSGKLTVARSWVAELGLNLLRADLSRLTCTATELESTLRVLIREAWLRRALLFIEGIDSTRPEEEPGSLRAVLLNAIAQHSGITVLACRDPWPAGERSLLNPLPVPFTTLPYSLRKQLWARQLGARGVTTIDESAIEALAGRFALTSGQIAHAVSRACDRALWRAASEDPPDALPSADTSHSQGSDPELPELFAAARAQYSGELGKLTRKIEPRQTWTDVVLPPDQTAQLREICEQARLRQRVYGGWGFERKLSGGKGLIMLFAGPPGTGKTMVAEVIAAELQLDLYRIDLSQVISKFIGETERNLDRIFTAALGSNAILFFDEADALFGKRSEVKDSHDRYANIEISYLLQKMEEYEGVAILATNLRQNLDEAFLRRMHSIVEFPFPDEEHRRRIWEVTFPREAPVGSDVDFSVLAREIRLAGGNIKNIALTASFYAAGAGDAIHMTHIALAARREHQKLGRTWERTLPAPPPEGSLPRGTPS